MKQLSISVFALLIAASLTACGGNKTDGNTTDTDTAQTAVNNNAPYAEPGQNNTYTASLAGNNFEITIKREADKTLPVVTDDLGKEFYDNRVEVTITKGGEEFFKKTYTKEAFAGFLTSESESQGTVLLGMAYDSAKSDGHAIRLGAQIGQVGIEEGPAFTIEIPLDGSASSIVRDNNQDTTGNDMTD